MMSEDCQVHVLHVVSGDLWAGAEVQLYTLAKTLHERLGARVSVVILNPGRLERELRTAGIRVIVLDESKLSGIQLLHRLVRILHDLRPDVVHTHRTKENILGSIAAMLSKVPSLRTVHGAPEHIADFKDVSKRIIQLMDWLCGRFFQRRIIAVSGDLADILLQKYPSRSVRVIENGIDVETLVDTKTHSEPRTNTSILHIGIAGRLVPVKRIDLFIRAAKQLHDTHRELDIDFHIYGDGPQRKELESIANSLDTGAYLHFEGHCDDIPAILHEHDMLLMTSDHEGMPMILLEAMALGVPVVAHRVGGITNLLKEGDCGILVKDHSPEGYADAVYMLATNPSLRTMIARKARHRVESLYTAAQNADSYCTEYQEMLSV
jgi:glycosyltransferase involved in cell wall biosynthesis